MPAEPIQATRGELRRLHFRLAATRARLLFSRILTGACSAAALLIAAFAAEMTLDWLAHLPWLARACISLPAIGATFWLIYREILSPLLRIPSDHAVACAVERALPIFQTRLIASIQFSRDAEAKQNALVRALIRETAAMADTQDFRRAVRTGKTLRAARLLAIVLLATAGLAWLGRGEDMLLIERALLLTTRLPSRTHLDVIMNPSKLAAGEDLKIDVTASGVIPASGSVVTESGAGRSEYKLERTSSGHFEAIIRSVPESLTFRVVLNDATSDPFSVKVFSPPVVLAVRCTEEFPAYTGFAAIDRPTGDLSLLAGSVLRLAITSSAPLSRGGLHLTGLEKVAPLVVDASHPSLARAAIRIPKTGLTGFSIDLVDGNGIPSRETTVYRIDIVPDRPPAIKITYPGQEEAATAGAAEVIAFHAEDDFGVAKVFLNYMVNQGDEHVISFDLGDACPRTVDRHFDWDLAALKVAPGGVIDYWLEADDANDVTGPGKGMTGHAQIRIVTENEKRTELGERMNDALGSLDEVSQSEDQLAKRLGERIFQKSAPPGGNPP